MVWLGHGKEKGDRLFLLCIDRDTDGRYEQLDVHLAISIKWHLRQHSKVVKI